MQGNRNAERSLADTYGLDSTSLRGSGKKSGLKNASRAVPWRSYEWVYDPLEQGLVLFSFAKGGSFFSIRIWRPPKVEQIECEKLTETAA